jgi:hypothetical protein
MLVQEDFKLLQHDACRTTEIQVISRANRVPKPADPSVLQNWCHYWEATHLGRRH